MPIWILILLIPLGEPFAYKGVVMDHADSYVECLKSMDNAEQDNPADQFACVEIK